MAQDVKMITAFGLKRAKNTCVVSSAALRRVYDRAQYLCLHWTFSVVTLQILSMLKQQHYTLTNAGPMMVYCIFILLKNVSSTCSSTTSSTFWSTTRSRVPHSGRPYSTSLVLSIPLSGSVVSVYYLIFCAFQVDQILVHQKMECIESESSSLSPFLFFLFLFLSVLEQDCILSLYVLYLLF